MTVTVERTFAYVGTLEGGTIVCYYIPIGGVLLLEHPRHNGRPNLNMFEWGTINNRSYFLAQAILQHNLRPAKDVTHGMIECYQREVIAKHDANERLRIEQSAVKQWIQAFLAKE